MSWSYITDRVTYNQIHVLGDIHIYDEVPWSCYDVSVTENCAPAGDGQCDGYSTNGHSCDCACHTHDFDMNISINGIEDWHRKMWAMQPEDFEG